MQTQVKRLRETLELLKPVVPRRPTLTALRNVLLKDGRAVATDLETAVEVEFPVEGECLVPFQPVSELLKNVPGQEMLDIEQRDGRVHMSWQGGKASYEVPAPEDYPATPEVKPVVETTVDGDTLVPALLEAAECCAVQEERPVLTGVALLTGDSIAVAGADGFRLAYKELPIALKTEGMESVVIPARAVRVLGHLWGRAPRAYQGADTLVDLVTARGKMEIALSEQRLGVRFGTVTLVTNLIQGTPPNFRQLIPQEVPHTVRVLSADLARAVRHVRDIARDGSGIVRLFWTEDTMTVSARSEGESKAETSLRVQADGGCGRVALNVAYLLDYLQGKDGLVTMGVRSVSEPVLFRYRGAPLVLVMPMFAQWPDEQAGEASETMETAAEGANEGSEPDEENTEPVDEPEEPKKASKSKRKG